MYKKVLEDQYFAYFFIVLGLLLIKVWILKFFVLAVPDDCKCGLAQRATRVVGGQDSEVNEWPWQAGLISKGNLLDPGWRCGQKNMLNLTNF